MAPAPRPSLIYCAFPVTYVYKQTLSLLTFTRVKCSQQVTLLNSIHVQQRGGIYENVQANPSIRFTLPYFSEHYNPKA
jgi:hypothetical protein